MTSLQSRNITKPSARACLSCRSKHLRCDGRIPKCARCLETQDECTYVRSRRGIRKGPSKLVGAEISTSVVEPVGIDTLPSLSQDSARQMPDSHGLQMFDQTGHQSPSGDTISIARNQAEDWQCERLIDVYYRTIHPAHPFLLPYRFYQRDRAMFPEHLLCAMRYIASHHTSADPEPYRNRVNRVYDVETPNDVFKVQTLLLLTLASYARFERDVGNTALSTALDLALRTNLGSNQFAPHQNLVVQESWRRTWWELFTISGLVSLISGSGQHLHLPDGMTLPEHDDLYEEGKIGMVGTSADMQQRFLSEDVVSWSSFAYRIEAMRILNHTLALPITSASSNEYEAVRASITSFLLSIPKDKADGLRESGEVDEVMSCALMIIHLANICLHIVRSDLGSVRGLTTVCGNDRGREILNTKEKSHRAACLNSAKALSNLLSIRTSLNTLSPCFSCAIAYAAVVQLAECRLSPTSQAPYLKEQLKMQLSALKSLGDIWPIANVVRAQIAQFSREVFLRPLSESAFYTTRPSMTEEPWIQELLNENFDVSSEGFSIPGMGFNDQIQS